MAFDDIIKNSTDHDIKRDHLITQALKRQEYNRNYQAKLRNVSRLITLEKRIDAELDHVLGYIKTKYAKEYEAWVAPVKYEPPANQAFTNWLILSADEYKSIKEAYEVSGLDNDMILSRFSSLFKYYYEENNRGRWIKVNKNY